MAFKIWAFLYNVTGALKIDPHVVELKLESQPMFGLEFGLGFGLGLGYGLGLAWVMVWV